MKHLLVKYLRTIIFILVLSVLSMVLIFGYNTVCLKEIRIDFPEEFEGITNSEYPIYLDFVFENRPSIDIPFLRALIVREKYVHKKIEKLIIRLNDAEAIWDISDELISEIDRTVLSHYCDFSEDEERCVDEYLKEKLSVEAMNILRHCNLDTTYAAVKKLFKADGLKFVGNNEVAEGDWKGRSLVWESYTGRLGILLNMYNENTFGLNADYLLPGVMFKYYSKTPISSNAIEIVTKIED